MSVEATFICYLIALVAFILVALNVALPRVSVLGVGFAAAILPTFWNAMEAL